MLCYTVREKYGKVHWKHVWLYKFFGVFSSAILEFTLWKILHSHICSFWYLITEYSINKKLFSCWFCSYVVAGSGMKHGCQVSFTNLATMSFLWNNLLTWRWLLWWQGYKTLYSHISYQSDILLKTVVKHCSE